MANSKRHGSEDLAANRPCALSCHSNMGMCIRDLARHGPRGGDQSSNMMNFWGFASVFGHVDVDPMAR